MSDRISLALPIDVIRQFDHTATQVQVDNNTFQATPDDRDMLASKIADAEDEFRQHAELDTRVSRTGVPGDLHSFETVEYKVPGHASFKKSWSRVGRDYTPTEATLDLENDRIVPFDPDEGDEVRIYRGMRAADSTTDQWEDVTDDQGDLWDIINHRTGVLTIHPIEIHRGILGYAHGIGTGSKLEKIRVKLCYRSGTLGRGRSFVANTDLGESIDDSQTGGVDVSDIEALPQGPITGTETLRIGSEYVSATLDRENEQIILVERAIRGTEASSHDSSDMVQYVPPAYRKAVGARAGMALVQGGRYEKYLPDNEDDISKSELLDILRETWDNTLTALKDEKLE